MRSVHHIPTLVGEDDSIVDLALGTTVLMQDQDDEQKAPGTHDLDVGDQYVCERTNLFQRIGFVNKLFANAAFCHCTIPSSTPASSMPGNKVCPLRAFGVYQFKYPVEAYATF